MGLNKMTDFELAVKTAAEKAVLKIISEGNWLDTYYNNRFKIPADFMADIWKMVDVEKIKNNMAERIEQELSDRVINSMAAELATDVKQILSVKERREAIRSVAREHLDFIMKSGIDK